MPTRTPTIPDHVDVVSDVAGRAHRPGCRALTRGTCRPT